MVKAKTYYFDEDAPRGKVFKDIIFTVLNKSCSFQIQEKYNTHVTNPIDCCEFTADGYVKPCKSWRSGLLINCYYQAVTGTAYRKLPYVVFNALRANLPAPLLLIFDGDFYYQNKAGKNTLLWVKGKVDKKKIIGAITFQELNTWCQRGNGTQASLREFDLAG